MFFNADLVGLLLFSIQQLGVALGLGGQTTFLAAYIIAHRDGVIDEKELQFERASRRILNVGILCVVVSGALITLIHVLGGDMATVMSPAYLFKCALIGLATVLSIFSLSSMQGHVLGLAGGTWYALFVVHILATVTTWVVLLSMYAVWMVGFYLAWWALTRERATVVAPAAVPVPTPMAKASAYEMPKRPPQPIGPEATPLRRPQAAPKPLQPKAQPPQPPPQPQVKPALPVPPKPASPSTAKPDAPPEPPKLLPVGEQGLPTIMVMPKPPERPPQAT